MTTVTKLTLESGDRAALDAVVEEIGAEARRKGADCRGPHSDPPTEHPVPLYKRLDGQAGAEFERWRYTVYTRRLELVGHDDLVRGLVDREFPDSVAVQVEIEQVRDAGR